MENQSPVKNASTVPINGKRFGESDTFYVLLGEIVNILTTTVIFLIIGQLVSESLRRLEKWRRQKSVKVQQGKRIAGMEALPGPVPFPFPFKYFIGNVYQMWPLSKTLAVHQGWADEFGEIYTLFGSNSFGVALNSPDLIQTMLKSSNLSHVIKSTLAYDLMKPFITNGVLVSRGKFWQHERKILLRSMAFQNLKSYVGMLNRHSQRFIGSLEKMFSDGKVHQINDLISSSFLEVICEMITGFDIHNTKEGVDYHHNFEKWKLSIPYRMIHPFLLPNFMWKLSPIGRSTCRAVDDMFDFARKKIALHKKNREEREKMRLKNNNNEDVSSEQKNMNTNNGVPSPAPFRTVLDELIDAGVSNDQIVDEVNTMLFGGHETGASAIHFFCFTMSLHPDMQKLCRKEVDAVFEDPMLVQNGSMTYESLTGLKYLERVLMETIRLFPPVVTFVRELQAPLRINYRGQDVDLPVGCQVVLLPYVLHRNAKYFPDPLRFDPDRFLPEECIKRDPYAFIPFSGGPRDCLGRKLAILEIKMIAAYLIRNFEMFTTDSFDDITIHPNLTLTPSRNMNFVFKKRNSK